jgi:hypothetical protein
MPGRFIVSVLLCWAATLLHRELIGLPIAMARADAGGNISYDGVGGNLVLLFGGWIFGLFSSALVLLVYFVVQHGKTKRKLAAL